MDGQGNDIFFLVKAETGRPAVVSRSPDGELALSAASRS
jgi:hypothetical protein